MENFDVGDRVRLAKGLAAWALTNMGKEGIFLGAHQRAGCVEVKFDNSTNETCEVDYGYPWALELVEKVKEHPEEITHNGVTYIRKPEPEPEPEHVWKFGDWARVKKKGFYGGQVGLVTGPIRSDGVIIVAIKGCLTDFYCIEVMPEYLEYISSATIPE